MYFETQLKLTQSATHMQSFKEISDMVQNGYEDLKETTSWVSQGFHMVFHTLFHRNVKYHVK